MLPNPPCAPEALVVPERTTSRFEPMEANASSTRALAPSPMATMAITADTPMITPRVVRNERILLRRSARTATRSTCNGLTAKPPRRRDWARRAAASAARPTARGRRA